MKKYFEHLRPMERRLVIGAAVILFLIINWWQVWPHFSDWGDYSRRLQSARTKLSLYQTASGQIPKLQAQVNEVQSGGDFVPPEDQSIDLMRTIGVQASASGFGIQSFSRQVVHTNDVFYIEQVQNIVVQATEEQLVNFLYKLGTGASMIRVHDLELQPDFPHYHLSANIKLVANYQKSSKAPAVARKPAPPAAPAEAMPANKVNFFGNAKRATNSTALKK